LVEYDIGAIIFNPIDGYIEIYFKIIYSQLEIKTPGVVDLPIYFECYGI